jgi:uncharacterized protein
MACCASGRVLRPTGPSGPTASDEPGTTDRHEVRTAVALDERLLDILVCPACKGEVEHKERRHLIVCTACGLRYPVRDGIPVMLVEEASAPR